MAYGINDEGFSLKRLSNILADLQLALSTVQDPITGETLTVDLADEDDPLIQQVNAFADGLAQAWEELQLAYNQFDPLKATGAGLSGLVQLNGITRNEGDFATVPVSLTGTPGRVMEAGKQASTMDGSFLFNLPQITFDEFGNAVAIATCATQGPCNIEIGTLVKIITPDTAAGWSSITNTAVPSGGVLEETDTTLRGRQQVSTSTTASSVIDSLYGALRNLTGVRLVRVYQNKTLITDARGITGKAVAAVVVGGVDEDIAQVIFQKGGIGLDTYGNTVVSITGAQEIAYPIYFQRPTPVDIYIEVNITVVDASSWPADGEDQIKAAILLFVLYGASALGITTGYDQDGYTPGQSVFASELYTPVNQQVGISITSLFVDIVSPAVSSSVTINWNEIANFDSANIVINTTI